MSEEKKLLIKYIPKEAVEPILNLFDSYPELFLKITRYRKTKIGDYRRYHNKKHQITINKDLNPYQFLLTLLHEIAHFITYKNYGRKVKPHGKEWKNIFGSFILEYLNYDAFPDDLKTELMKYAYNPKASTNGDGKLFIKISEYDKNKNNQLKYIFELKTGTIFITENGITFRLGKKRRTRYECVNLYNKKNYLVHKNTKVLPVKNY